MAIRHIILFQWKPTFTEEIRDEWYAGLDKIADGVPGVLALQYGEDIVKGPNSYDHALIVDFESEDAMQTYSTHPLHEAIKPLSMPNIENMVVVDYEI